MESANGRRERGRGALIPLRSPFVMGIRKKEHVIGIDRWSEPDHGFRKLAKPDIVWLLGFRKPKIHRTYFSYLFPSAPSPANLAPLRCRRDHCCRYRYCYDSLDHLVYTCTHSSPSHTFVFVLSYRPTACPKGPQSGTLAKVSQGWYIYK